MKRCRRSYSPLQNPAAAAFEWQREGELTLASRLLARQPLPERSLLLADRLFGLPPLIRELLPALEKSHSAVLFRIKSNLKAKRVKTITLTNP